MEQIIQFAPILALLPADEASNGLLGLVILIISLITLGLLARRRQPQ